MVDQHQFYTTPHSKYANYARSDDVDQSIVFKKKVLIVHQQNYPKRTELLF